MQRYADEVASLVSAGANILEVAPGPGYLSIELAKKGFTVTGIEISPDFVKIAKNNAQEENDSVDFKEVMPPTYLARIILLILLFAVLHLRISKSPLKRCMKCIECLNKEEHL